MAIKSPAVLLRRSQRFAIALPVVFVAAFASLLYGVRLSDQPIVGEESRWGAGAREMLESGDWIVPRQQGVPFPERPPMTMWLMALVGAVRGDVDVVAIRLPSVIAVVLTSLVIYGYTRSVAGGFAAFVASMAYASFGQVLQIGRMGESEAVFALLVGSSLLGWHLGYLRGWPKLATWSLGFALAALAALVKGPQAPVYFVAITAVYLLVRRDWWYAIGWQYVAGAALFASIIAAWQIPFYLATDLETVTATWAGLASDRVHLAGLAKHLVSYPLETFACLLPWSPILVALAKRETRDLVADRWPVVSFLLIAMAVAYPTVWIAAGARGRYFMPLYPLAAVLVGIVVERCSAAAIGGYPRRAWQQFLLLSGILICLVSLIALAPAEWSLARYLSLGCGAALVAVALVAIVVLLQCYRANSVAHQHLAILVIAAFAATLQAGALINLNIAKWNNPAAAVDQLKEIVGDVPLVSLTPIDHRFAYLYGEPITELDWPRAVNDLPAGVDYFCFMRHPADTAQEREAGRGRTWIRTPGTLPFAWEEVATLCVERRLRDYPQRMLVLGRVAKPRQAMVSDATVPREGRNLTAATGTTTQRVPRDPRPDVASQRQKRAPLKDRAGSDGA